MKDINTLINWSKQYEHLPWRRNRSLYRTLVSEIMLQQTTVATVRNKFEDFLSQYPSLLDLATDTEEKVLIAWKGLGYYRRAKNLLAAAKDINVKYSGNIPTNYDQLIAIPGIGDYTANAILGIGDEQRVLAIDTNIERVIARYYGLDVEKGLKLKKAILDLFEKKEILNFDVSFRLLNEALMDLGREYCTSTKAHCSACPLQTNCRSKENPQARPVVQKVKKTIHALSLLRILIIEDNHLLCYKKTEGEWLASQWECPTFIVSSRDNLTQYPLVSYPYEDLIFFKTSITKYKISNYILPLSLKDFNRLFSWERELIKIPMFNKNNCSVATQKAIHFFKQHGSAIA